MNPSRISCARLFAIGILALNASCGGDSKDGADPPTPAASTTPEESATPPPPPTATHVGAQNCRECHAQEYDDWTQSHHFLAMQPANGDTVLGDFENASFSHFGHQSKFFKKDGKFLVNTEDGEGQRRDFEITHTFGYEPLQQYLIPFPGGRLQALQICWDTRPADQGGQRWFHLYPDEAVPPGDVLHWTGQHFNWNFMCADCHSTNLEKNYDFPSLSYDTKWSEINVSCEACHGPGSEHVAWAREPDEAARAKYPGHLGLQVRFSESEPGAWTVDPDSGKPKRTHPHDAFPPQAEVCARCHSHRTPLQSVFEHGLPFHDTHRPSRLDDRLYHHDGQIKEEVFVYGSYVQSKMHHAGVRCTDCHQPHTMKPLAEGNALCVRCHTPERYDSPAHHFHPPASAGASCVECHMPHTTYMVVDDRRDHSIRIPRPDLSDKLGTPNACNRCHTDKSNQWAADAISTWHGGRPTADSNPHPGELFLSARHGTPASDADLARLASNPAFNPIYRATALEILQNIPTPTAAQAILRGRNDPDPAVRASAAASSGPLTPDQRRDSALPLLKDPSRAVRIEAARSLAPFRRSLTGDQANDFDAAARDLVAAQVAIFDRAGGHQGLGLFFTDLGEFDRAEQAYNNGLRVDPADIPCAANLAELLHGLDRTSDGLPYLENAARLNPDSAAVWEALSIYHVRAGQKDKALDSLSKATKLDPASSRFAYFYGLALHDAKRSDEALASLEKAHSLAPADPEPLFALATISRDIGRLQEAIRHAHNLLPLDPARARQLLDQLAPSP